MLSPNTVVYRNECKTVQMHFMGREKYLHLEWKNRWICMCKKGIIIIIIIISRFDVSILPRIRLYAIPIPSGLNKSNVNYGRSANFNCMAQTNIVHFITFPSDKWFPKERIILNRRRIYSREYCYDVANQCVMQWQNRHCVTSKLVN